MRTTTAALALLLAACGAPGRRAARADPPVATFSIAAYDAATGDLGVAVQSKFFGVGVVVPWVRADVGAVATQAWANPHYGPDGLALLDDGADADAVVASLTAADAGRDRRQVGVVDARGRAAAFTGTRASAWAGHHVGEGFCCQGNILAGARVVSEMARAYEAARGDLAARLLAALEAGQAAGGDRRGRQSAALVVARRHGGYGGANDRYLDLRVDDHPRPIEELARLLEKRRVFDREPPVPRRVPGLVREPREGDGARAVFLRWMRLRRRGDHASILALATAGYRAAHGLAELEASERRAAAHASPARLPYLGTRFEPPEIPREARLVFDEPGAEQPVEVRLVREGGRWAIVPAPP